MPERPKRPGLPVPDPNWELELHGPTGSARGSSPESKDEMLAHALLRAEPDPLDLGDDFGELDLERSTLPPPEAMSLHVARMMAQAELIEGLEGDRPTPLLDDDRTPSPRMVPFARQALEAAKKGGPVVRFETDRKDTPLLQLDPGDLGGLRRAPEPAKKVTPPAPAEPERKMTPEPLSLSRVPHSQGPSDLSDLPAVFMLDGLDEPASEAAISPALAAPPSSEPAISPPFASLDAEELAAALERAKGPSADTMSAIETRFAAGDYGRALVLAESALSAHPGDPQVTQVAEDCREMLYQRYLERLGANDHIPRLAMNRAALTGLTLDHRAGFLLSCVDGGSTLEEIIDVSAMPRLEAVRLLYELVQEGVIEMASPR